MLDAAVKRLPRFLMDIAPIQRLIDGPTRLRLVAKPDAPKQPARAGALPALGTSQWSELAYAATDSQDATLNLLRAWLDQGRSWPDIYLHGISPTAQLMGDWWAADHMDFASMSMGVVRLQTAMYALSPEFMTGLPGVFCAGDTHLALERDAALDDQLVHTCLSVLIRA